MKVKRIHLALLGLILFSSSCATLMNKSYMEITVRTEQPLNFILEGDTIMNESGEDFTFFRKNDVEPIPLKVYNDEGVKRLPIFARKSPWYWANATLIGAYVVGAPVGALVDELTGKKWTYPKQVYIDMNSPKGYLYYFPMDSSYHQYKNRISITPLSSVELYHPGIEFSYLRHHDTESATQLTFSSLLSRNNEHSREAEGFEIGIEHKIYLRNAERTRLYVSGSFDYLNKDHRIEADLWAPEEDTPQWEWDRFRRLVTIEKRFYNFTPRIGIEQYLTRRLVLEAYTGIGVRYRDVRMPGIDPETVAPNDGWFWDSDRFSNSPRKNIGLNLDANFRLGIQF